MSKDVKHTFLAGRELDNGQSVEVSCQYDMEYEDEGVVLFCIDVWSDYDKSTDIYDTHVATNIYVYPDGSIKVRERGL